MQDCLRQIEELYQRDFRRLFATVVRLLGDLDLAEDALQDAFAVAMQKWPEEGMPGKPGPWLVSTARFKAIDRIRKQSRLELGHDGRFDDLPAGVDTSSPDLLLEAEESIEDDRLRLIFTCCHPAIALDVQIALTLREVCGLTTEAIAAAMLLQPATLAQRLVRGKAKIRRAGIPYEVPTSDALPERLDSVLTVIYLVFNEGYHASSGSELIRADLAAEAIRLARLLFELLPDPEVMGLLALMLLSDARQPARRTATGDLVLLEDQDRSLWNRALIAEGKRLLERAMQGGELGPYTIQAAIAATHSDATTTAETNWSRIVSLYHLLMRASPSPVVELNHAVAVAMRDGAAQGLALVDGILARGDLRDYHLAHAARADLHRRLGNKEEARTAYLRALALTRQQPQQRFLEKRLRDLEKH